MPLSWRRSFGDESLSTDTGGTGQQNRPSLVYFLDDQQWGPNRASKDKGLPSFSGATSSEITGLLKAWNSGDEAALARLAEYVYPELRAMARRHMRNEREGNTLQTTALVNEVYLRLVDVTKVEWRQRAQFFAMAAQMMRRILVDSARARAADKRGGRAVKVNLDETAVLASAPNRSIIALDEALTAFALVAPRQAKVVELRYFGGLTEDEITVMLKVSTRTVRRDWDFAKAWLLRELSHRIGEPGHATRGPSPSRSLPTD
jgi:RNA polymerase sigma factor (TIGR02999 family)